MPADIADMVGYMKGIYDIQDADGQDGYVTDMATLKTLLIDAAIEGSNDGSVKGLSELLGNIPKNADLNEQMQVKIQLKVLLHKKLLKE